MFLLLYFILYCSNVPTVIVAMRCVIVSINHYLSIYLSISILLVKKAGCFVPVKRLAWKIYHQNDLPIKCQAIIFAVIEVPSSQNAD